MRLLLTTVVLLASVAAASAQIGPGGKAGPTFDVPAKPTTVYVLRRDLKPGEEVTAHTHAGVEMTEVIAGDFDLTADGKTVHHHGGDSFMVPRGVVHSGKNVGTTTATLAVTYVLDKGAPLRTDAK